MLRLGRGARLEISPNGRQRPSSVTCPTARYRLLPHGGAEVPRHLSGVPFTRVRLGTRTLFRWTVSQYFRGRVRPHSQILPQRHWPEAVPHRQAVSRWKRASARRLRLRRENLNNVPLRLRSRRLPRSRPTDKTRVGTQA